LPSKLVKLVGKHRKRKIKPPYRRYGPGNVSLEEALRARGEGEAADDHECGEGEELDDSEGVDPLSSLKNELANVEATTRKGAGGNSIPQLPLEIIEEIIRWLPRPISPKLMYVSRMWYTASLRYVYEAPVLNVHNYVKFVESISSSARVGNFVRVLDLRNIIQSGKNSYTARLLRRCSANLEIFIAPQTSFGHSPLVSLKQCRNLRTLDLGLVSETVDLRELFHAIRGFKYLERLEFPRSSVFCQHYDNVWPENIRYLGLAGGISNSFVNETSFPTTIRTLAINNSPFINSESVRSVCGRLGRHLTTLYVVFPMPALRPNALDSVLKLCPNLTSLTASVDYLTRHIFSTPNMPTDPMGRPVQHPLKFFTLDSSGMLGQAGKIHADDICLAILENKVPNLTHIRISNKLGWNPEEEDVTELLEVVNDRQGGLWMY
jgi:hypothetical protein